MPERLLKLLVGTGCVVFLTLWCALMYLIVMIVRQGRPLF